MGVDLPNNKRTDVALTYLYGIGPTLSARICEQAAIEVTTRAKDLTDDELSRITNIIENNYAVEGTLRRQVSQNIARLRDIACYRGLRHRKGITVRGQRTRTNARTRKGPKKTTAGKKK